MFCPKLAQMVFGLSCTEMTKQMFDIYYDLWEIPFLSTHWHTVISGEHQMVVDWICHVRQSQITRQEYSLLLIIIAEQLQIKCLPQVERNGLRPSPDPLLGLNFEFWILRKRSPTSPLWTHDIDSDHTLIFPWPSTLVFSLNIISTLATKSVWHGVPSCNN